MAHPNQFCLLTQPAREKIGVVDSQWIVHQTIPSLKRQVSLSKGCQIIPFAFRCMHDLY